MVNDTQPNMGKAQIGAWLSIAAYIVLALAKCWTGLKTHSEGMFADGLNNISDIFLSIAILIGLKVSQRPADQNHPFGHCKAETIATLMAAFFMVLMAVEIGIRAVQGIWTPRQTPIDPGALYVSIGSAVILFAVSTANFSLSRKTGSQALFAAAHDNRSDALVSIGTAIGITGTNMGWYWTDPLVALIVGGMILKAGWEVGRPAIDGLMDGFDKEKLERIRLRVLMMDGINEVKELRARYHGPHVFIEITIGVNASLSVVESHQLTEQVEEELIGFENIRHVHIHVEPSDMETANPPVPANWEN
ncbi:MAG: cation diffusion facilitator family transporter [Thermoactinomyces sp.]